MAMSQRAQMIDQRLREQLAADHVEVIDNSAAHADHPGARGGGGYFRVVVVSPNFEGLSTLASQRLVYQALGDLMATHIHALQMQTMTPRAWRQTTGGAGCPE